MRRAHAVVAAALLAVGGVAAPSAALTTEIIPECDPSSDRYTEIPGGCAVLVEDIDSDCVAGVPQLSYELSVRGPITPPIQITWENDQGGQDVVVQGGLSGTIHWPGTVVNADGTVADWPGWTQQANGTWVQGDEFDWALGSVDVTFGTNPSVTRTVQYPDRPECRPAGAVLAANTTTTTRTPAQPAAQAAAARSTGLSGVLAATGVEASTLAAGAGALLVGGTALVLARRSRHTAE